jgi:orotate phosphoribosyltransferase-like protein
VGKYSSVQSLAQQGLSIEEIASILDVSTHEAHQLVNLSKLAQGSLA